MTASATAATSSTRTPCTSVCMRSDHSRAVLSQLKWPRAHDFILDLHAAPHRARSQTYTYTHAVGHPSRKWHSLKVGQNILQTMWHAAGCTFATITTTAPVCGQVHGGRSNDSVHPLLHPNGVILNVATSRRRAEVKLRRELCDNGATESAGDRDCTHCHCLQTQTQTQ
jgi:hypothetical protein